MDVQKLKQFLTNSKYRFIIYGAVVGLFIGGLIFGIGSVLMRGAKETISITPDPPPEYISLQTPSPTPSLKPIDDLTGKAKSMLTGLYIDEKAASRRPFAVSINNMHLALPQSGISQAGITYAVLAEGGITRLVCVFDEFDAEKIGPVRSARDYFLSFAYDNDAIFVHHGGSPKSYTMIKNLKVDNLDGTYLEGVTFWRDQERYKIPSMMEHSSYTSAERLLAKAEEKYETKLSDGLTGLFDFYEKPTSPDKAQPATEIYVPFSASYPITFKYDENTKLYSVFERDNKQIDKETGEQLTTTNIIIQFTKINQVAGDDAGRLNVTTTGSGSGYIVTNGGYAPITWEKSDLTGQTEYFSENGEKLKVNAGKTWICVHNGKVDFS